MIQLESHRSFHYQLLDFRYICQVDETDPVEIYMYPLEKMSQLIYHYNSDILVVW